MRFKYTMSFWIPVFLIGILLLPSCKKFNRITKVKTNEVSEIASESVTANAQIIDLSNSTSHDDYGFCYSTAAEPSVADYKISLGVPERAGNITAKISGLENNKKYFLNSYIKEGDGYVYGVPVSFTTKVALPTVTTSPVTTLSPTTATGGGNVIKDGGVIVTERGVCWNTSMNPTITGLKTSDSSGTGSFTSSISGLIPSETYYIRAYATNSAGTSYGNEITFTAQNPTLPTVTTSPVNNISANTSVCGGNVTDDGGSIIISRGVCWSTSSNPTISDSKTIDSSGIGSFTSIITGLSVSTAYYGRAYATNSVGTAYGLQVSFFTDSLPNVSTNPILNISLTTATGGGNVISDGGENVTSRGVCWNTSQNPTIANSKTINGAGIGSFTSYITGLSVSTFYYVRAYAINSGGVSYGLEVSFITQNPTLPTVTTSSISNIIQTTAISGGNITYDGGSMVTARGVCWSITQNPTITNSKTNNGTGTGSFVSNITGLSGNSVYYVRAYATNSVGTSYGNEVSFATSVICPSVVTDYDGNTYTTAIIGNQCWMNQNLKTTHYSNGSVIDDGTGVGDISNNYTSKYYFDYGDNPTNTTTYGRLYTWAAVMDGVSSSWSNPSGVLGVCPTGWHLPSDGEWTQLTDYLGGESVAGGKMKETGTSHWNSPNTGANNTSNFTALPGGYRLNDGTFSFIGQYGAFWTATQFSVSSSWDRLLNYNYGSVTRNHCDKAYGMSVRCIKDE